MDIVQEKVPCGEIAYVPPSLLERLEQERTSLIKRLGETTVKIEMLKADPTLAEKINFFNNW